MHDCTQHQDNSTFEVPRKDYHKYLPKAAVPFITMPIKVRKDVVAWYEQKKQAVPEGFWSQECENELQRVEAAIAEASRRRSKATDSDSEHEKDVGAEARDLETGARDRVRLHCNPKRVRQQERTREIITALYDRRQKAERRDKRKRDASRSRDEGAKGARPGYNTSDYGSAGAAGGPSSSSGGPAPMDYSDETEDSQRPARGYSSGSQWPALGAGSSQSTPEPTLASLIASESGAPGGKPPKPKKDRFKIDMPYLRRWKFHSIPIRQSPYGAAFYGNVNELNNEGLTCLLTGFSDRPSPIVTIKEDPPCGRFLVVDEESEVRAYASITLHRDNPNTRQRTIAVRQFNPFGFPYVGDLINRSYKPHTVTHYFALSCPISPGEYRIVFYNEDPSSLPWYTGMYYVETGRLHGEIMDPAIHCQTLLRQPQPKK